MEHPYLVFDFFNIPVFDHYPHILFTWLLLVLLPLFSYLVMRRASVVPNPVQNVIELLVLGLRNMVKDTMGEKGMVFMPLLVTEALFIFTANIIGIIPGFHSPTADINTNSAMAIVVFITTHVVGVKVHGFKYIKQFLGPVWWLTPLMFPIELISHLSRPLSLTVRLFGNIRGEDMVLFVLLILLPYLVPLPIMLLMILTSVLQTFVFVLLTMLYISGAMEEPH